jgi:hypothetical protein
LSLPGCELADSPDLATIDHDTVDWQLTTALIHLT